jgi:hypothetical protein
MRPPYFSNLESTEKKIFRQEISSEFLIFFSSLALAAMAGDPGGEDDSPEGASRSAPSISCLLTLTIEAATFSGKTGEERHDPPI